MLTPSSQSDELIRLRIQLDDPRFHAVCIAKLELYEKENMGGGEDVGRTKNIVTLMKRRKVSDER